MSTRDLFAIIFFAVIAVFLVYSVSTFSEIHEFGNPDQNKTPEMDQYIIDNTQNETGADNGVTAVVFDYRGFDTLGEATVLFTAVAAVILIFRRLKK
jgi:multisubunit Na+/H+ antiporter MnhB subunit